MSNDLRAQYQQEAFEALKARSGVAVMPVRTGKTFVGLSLADYYDEVLVAYPSKSILESWKSDAEKFNINIDHVTFTTFSSLVKHDLSKFDMVLIDEIDQLSEARWEFLSRNRPKILNGLTATLPRKGTRKRFYIESYAPIRYEIKIDQTVGVLNKPYHIYVHLVNPSEARDIPKQSGGFWSEKAKINFFENHSGDSFAMMLRLIQTISGSPTKWNKLRELLSDFDRCLVFVETIQQCGEICRYSYHSKNSEEVNKENLRMFNSGEINFLATVNQLNAGITFPNLNRAVILHAYASSSKAAQRIGRALNYLEGEKAELHIICMNNTRDIVWTRKGLEYYGAENITWIEPK